MNQINSNETVFKWIKSPFSIMLGIVFLGNLIFSKFPRLTETIYSNGIFSVLRIGYDYTLGFLPFPMIYVLFASLVLYIAFVLVRWVKNRKTFSFSFEKMLYSIYGWVASILFCFYFLWGFNYQRVPLNQHLGLGAVEINRDYLLSELTMITETMDSLRSMFVDQGIEIMHSDVPKDLETQIREQQKRLLDSWNLSTTGRVRIRKLKPEGLLLRISTAGVYIPFVNEGHIDAGLHPIQWPATMAHEMAHGYGQTDEGVCNFIGFLTCITSDDEVIAYSGWMMYLRYVLATLRKLDRAGYSQLIAALPETVLADIKSIQKQLAKFPDIFPAARDVIYDQYLKSHGVKDGLKSYSTIIQMVADWKQSEHNAGIMNLD